MVVFLCGSVMSCVVVLFVWKGWCFLCLGDRSAGTALGAWLFQTAGRSSATAGCALGASLFETAGRSGATAERALGASLLRWPSGEVMTLSW